MKKTNKNGEEITKTIACKLKLIESTRVIASSLLNLVDTLIEEIHNLNVNMDTTVRNLKNMELNKKIVSAIFNMET